MLDGIMLMIDDNDGWIMMDDNAGWDNADDR